MDIISNNEAKSKIIRFGFTQQGLNREENMLILRDTPRERFIRATTQYNLCIDHVAELEESLQPSLEKFMSDGPFTLVVHNQGYDISNSFLAFDLEPAKPPKIETKGAIIEEDPFDVTARSLAIIPFTDIFKTLIEKEAERAARLINSSKVSQLQQRRLKNESDTTQAITTHFMNQLQSMRGASPAAQETRLGKEAISDTLAPNLRAKKEFYDTLWSNMLEFFEPAYRHVAEQCALGNITLPPAQPIRVISHNQKEENPQPD